MKELVDTLNAASAAYQAGEEIMSNYDFDLLYAELQQLENETGIILPDSPTQKVDVEINSALEKVEHEYSALSLDKTKDITLFPNVFAVRDNMAVIMWKEDGSTLVATYDGGKLTKLVTRGNGYIGQDVTHNAKYIHGLPLTIAYKGHLVSRGEALMSYEEFERINSELSDEPYKNARNLANATVQLQEGKNMENREIWFHAFKLVYADSYPEARTFNSELEWLHTLGFTVVDHVLCPAEKLSEEMEKFSSRVSEYQFPVDGLVVAANDVAYAMQQPSTNKYANRLVGFALKWEDETVETILKEIEWSASRTGLLNPVAVFEPVELEGTTVCRASVHNVSIIKKLRLRVGDRISVYKANKIIPQIANNLTEGAALTYQESHPVVCPCCGMETNPIITRNENTDVEVAVCPNPECPAKHTGRYVHFCERDGMNVVGLSKATIEKLVSKGWIKEFADIYTLSAHKEEIIGMDGFGEKSYTNLMAAIDESRKTSFVPFLYALGIPGIGQGQAKLIAKAYNHDINAFFYDIYMRKNFTWIDGIGDVLTDNLHQWGNKYLRYIPFLNDGKKPECNQEIKNLMEQLTFQVPQNDISTSKLDGLTFVITGDVNHFTNRDALKAEIEKNGGKVSGSVSSKTSYLINNNLESTSGKNKKARELGIRIISENEFLEMIE